MRGAAWQKRWQESLVHAISRGIGKLLFPALCLSAGIAAAAASAGVGQVGPTLLTKPVTLSCHPPLVTQTDALVPRQLLVIRAEFQSSLGGVMVWTNGNTGQYSFVGPKSFWWSRSVCEKTSLPSALPRAQLVRLAQPTLTCVIPGRRVLVHAARRNGKNSMTLRVMPHGQLLLRVEFQGATIRSYASRYAVRLCERDA